MRKKSKWISGLLAFLVPGTGHMYLGLMLKGIVLMGLIALDICAIVYVSIEANNVLSIVLLSLLMPIIYFYNFFDAIQSTDVVNERLAAPSADLPPEPRWHEKLAEEGFARASAAGGTNTIFLIAAGVAIVIMGGISWTNWFFNFNGSMIGAVVLISAGVGLWIWEKRGQHGGN